MTSQVDLKVDFCSYQAAKYAVEHWHYSRVMPAGKTVKAGVWEDGRFIGAVVFIRGANKNIGSPYGLDMTAVCELGRAALQDHTSPVSQIVIRAIKLLRQTSPGIRLLISYADPEQGHNGRIYQAMNWVYEGLTKGGAAQIVLPGGGRLHKRTATSIYGTCKAADFNGHWSQPLNKHKYLYPLDRAMRRQIEPLSQPYPKRAAVVSNGNTPGDQLGDGSSILSRPLITHPANGRP